MKTREEYQKELEQIMSQLQSLEQQKQPLVNRGIGLQEILKEMSDEVLVGTAVASEVNSEETK